MNNAIPHALLFALAVACGVPSSFAATSSSSTPSEIAPTSSSSDSAQSAPTTTTHKKKTKKKKKPAETDSTEKSTSGQTPASKKKTAAAANASTNAPVSPSRESQAVETKTKNENKQPAVEPEKPEGPEPAPPNSVPLGKGKVSTIDPNDLREYASLSPQIKRVIDESLKVTRQNLTYKYGSDDPAQGGMDCSGTVHYILKQAGIKGVPRDSTDFYTWVYKSSRVNPVVSSSLNSFELDGLKPGDLLFWIGTYDIKRDPPISHVMIYLGKDKVTGRRLMVGASSGRRYEGVPRDGVSVFDFELPRPATGDSKGGEARFIGYGTIPGIADVPASND